MKERVLCNVMRALYPCSMVCLFLVFFLTDSLSFKTGVNLSSRQGQRPPQWKTRL